MGEAAEGLMSDGDGIAITRQSFPGTLLCPLLGAPLPSLSQLLARRDDGRAQV